MGCDALGQVCVGFQFALGLFQACLQGFDLRFGVLLPAVPAGDVRGDVADAFGADLAVTLETDEQKPRLGGGFAGGLSGALRLAQHGFEILAFAHGDDLSFDLDMARLRLGQLLVRAHTLRH